MGYVLGIVDEDANQQRKIRRTIKTNASAGRGEPEFKVYIAPDDNIATLKQLMDAIESDVSDHLIDGLIVDYDLVTPSANLRGTDIYKHLNELAPKLPVVLLTNYPEPCRELDYVDADKIYPKCKFFKIEEDYSKGKVSDLLENISKYSSQRIQLRQAFENEMNKFKEDSSDFKRYSKLIALEDELAKYAPQGSSKTMGDLNIDRLREAVKLIDQASAILGERNEEAI